MKATQKIIEEHSSLTILRPSESVELFLKDLLGVSATALKKFSFPKNFLSKKADKGLTLSLPLNLLNRGMIYPEYSGPEMKILFEDENLLALDKAPFIHSHPLSYSEGDNCLSFLRSLRNDPLLKVNEANYDRGLLYRLDYETSGVLVYLKKDELYQELRTHFSSIAKEKIYHCLVSGEFKAEGAHEHSFSSSGEKGHKILCVAPRFETGKKDWQRGQLKVRLLQFFPETKQSLLEVTLFTGLRHQIRAQLAQLGSPLLGDTLYGGEAHERLCLHAHSYKLEWKNLNYTLNSPSPWAINN